MTSKPEAPKTVAQTWGMFSRMVFGMTPPSPIQYQEMRRAFYAGFHTCFIEMACAAPGLGEEEAYKYFDAIQKECADFAAEIARGMA